LGRGCVKTLTLNLVDARMPPIMSFPGLFRAREIWIDDALCRAARCRRVALRQRRVAAIVIVEPPVRTCADKPGKPDFWAAAGHFNPHSYKECLLAATAPPHTCRRTVRIRRQTAVASGARHRHSPEQRMSPNSRRADLSTSTPCAGLKPEAAHSNLGCGAAHSNGLGAAHSNLGLGAAHSNLGLGAAHRNLGPSISEMG
jgi:hypothetical protein